MKIFKRIIYILLKKILKKLGYFKFGFPLYSLRDSGMGSHKKYLKYLLGKLNRHNPTIIEIGSGDHSSKLFINQLKLNPGILISFENNYDWHLKVKNKHKNNKNSEFRFLDNLSSENIKSELENLNIIDIDLSFIDSHPWESRTEAMELLRMKSKIVVIHDVDYFPRNNLWGVEIEPIKNSPRNKYFYGELKKENLGLRDYDDIFEYWIEIFPLYPGYYSGPPMLVGSNFIDVRKIFDNDKPSGHYFNSS